MKTLMQKMRSLVGRYAGQRDAGSVDVRVAFTTYKKILDDNDRALEIITDMGEKMSGGYLFDIIYIRKAYTDLAAGMRVSLEDFHQLTERHYPQLDDVFNRIDSHILALISGTAKPAERLTVGFDDITPEMAREVGGKNYHLSALRNRLGLEVPEGFALTAFAYEEFVRHNHLGEIIAVLVDDGDDSGRRRELRRKIMNGDLPPALEEALAFALKQLRNRCGKDCFLAVRSSAEEEDDVFSFAGQFETVLNVPAADFKAVRDAYREVLRASFPRRRWRTSGGWAMARAA